MKRYMRGAKPASAFYPSGSTMAFQKKCFTQTTGLKNQGVWWKRRKGGYHENGQYHLPYASQSVRLQAHPATTIPVDDASISVTPVVMGAISSFPVFKQNIGGSLPCSPH
jgi:hypothetical protein